jgi:hypothetical protein
MAGQARSLNRYTIGVQNTFHAFETEAHSQGFDEVLAREWAPLTEVSCHAHPFSFKALVVRGELWLTVDGQTQHLLVGDGFALGRNVMHSERYGSEGATYWVARRFHLDTRPDDQSRD